MSDVQSSSSSDDDDVDYHTCDEDDEQESRDPRAASPSSSSSDDGRDWLDYHHSSDDEDEEELDVLGAAAPVVAVKKETRQLYTRNVTGLDQQVQQMLQSCDQPNTQLLPTSSGRQAGDALSVTTGGALRGGSNTTLVQLNVTQQQFGDVTVEKATHINQMFGGSQNISKTATIYEGQRGNELSRPEIIMKRTVRHFQTWNQGMVRTAALGQVLDKLNSGTTWLTIKGNPGEGKTTVGYMALEELHRCGRQVFEVRSPDDFTEIIETCSRPAIMLDDVFGNLEFDQAKWSNWESVISPLLKEREHKSHEQNSESHFKDVTVILIGRDYVLNSASVDLGRLSDFLTSDRYVVCMDHTLVRDVEEKLSIWKSLSGSGGVHLDNRTVDKILKCEGPHGFPHVCRLFITIHKDNKAMGAEEFFRKPLEFLNSSMSKLFKDKHKVMLFKEMLKGDGQASMRKLRELDQSYRVIETGKNLLGSYLRSEYDSLVFDHPSIFDSVSFNMCSLDPGFVIEQCKLPFIHERVRLQLSKDATGTSESKLVVYVDTSYTYNLAKRFAAEISAHNFVYVLSHQAFSDRSFVANVMSLITSPVASILHLTDRNFPFCMEKSLLSLLPSSKSPELLKYVDRLGIDLTAEEINTVLHATCRYAASHVLTYLTDTRESLDINATIHESMKSPLMIAAETRDVQFVHHVLSLDPDLNARDEDERTALHYMCKKGLVAVVRQVIEKGADIDVEDRRKQTPLCQACRGNHLDVVELLIERKARIDVITLDAACRGGNITIVNLLLQKEASLSAPGIVQRAFLPACAGGSVDILDLFLVKGASVNSADYDVPPLQAACVGKQHLAVRWLLQHGADIDSKSKKKETALHRSAERGSAECLDLLLRAGATVNIQDEDDGTALHRAAGKGSKVCVELLLRSGATLDMQDKDRETALHKAAMSGSKDCIEVLLEAGASVNIQNMYGNSPLHRAAWNGSRVCVDLLLKAGASVNEQTKDGDTALHETVAEIGFTECVDLFLKAGARLNVQNKDGDTALHRAAYWGKTECVDMLLKAGAETTLTNKHGNTALHEAAGRGSKECVDLLLRAGAVVTIEDKIGNTALHRAAWNDSKECVDLMLKAGESVNTQNKFGNTALHRAAWNGSKECVDLLLKEGASVNIQNKHNNTALHRAAVRGSTDCVDLLLKAGKLK